MNCPLCGKDRKENNLYSYLSKKSGEKSDKINVYGTFCNHCGRFIDSEFELPLVKNNKEKKAKLLEKARESIKRKFGWKLGDT